MWSSQAVVVQLRATEADDDDMRAKRQQLSAFLQHIASTENAGCAITVLPPAPFEGAKGQNYVQLDAAVVANHMPYLGEHKHVLGAGSVGDLAMKLTRIRGALTHGRSPDLAAALHGMTRVQLFLAGEGVREGLAVRELADAGAMAGMSVVLPSAQGLEVVGAASAPVQLKL